MWHPFDFYWFRVVMILAVSGASLWTAFSILNAGKRGIVRITVTIVLVVIAIYVALHRIMGESSANTTAQVQAQLAQKDAEIAAARAQAEAAAHPAPPATAQAPSTSEETDEDSGKKSHGFSFPVAYDTASSHGVELKPRDVVFQKDYPVINSEWTKVDTMPGTDHLEWRGKVTCFLQPQADIPIKNPTDAQELNTPWVEFQVFSMDNSTQTPACVMKGVYPGANQLPSSCFIMYRSLLTKGEKVHVHMAFIVKPTNEWESPGVHVHK